MVKVLLDTVNVSRFTGVSQFTVSIYHLHTVNVTANCNGECNCIYAHDIAFTVDRAGAEVVYCVLSTWVWDTPCMNHPLHSTVRTTPCKITDGVITHGLQQHAPSIYVLTGLNAALVFRVTHAVIIKDGRGSKQRAHRSKPLGGR